MSKKNNAIVNEIMKNRPKCEKQIKAKIKDNELIRAQILGVDNIKAIRLGIKTAYENKLSKEEVDLLCQEQFLLNNYQSHMWIANSFKRELDNVRERLRELDILSLEQKEILQEELFGIFESYCDSFDYTDDRDILDIFFDECSSSYAEVDLLVMSKYNLRASDDIVRELLEDYIDFKYNDLSSGNILEGSDSVSEI